MVYLGARASRPPSHTYRHAARASRRACSLEGEQVLLRACLEGEQVQDCTPHIFSRCFAMGRKKGSRRPSPPFQTGSHTLAITQSDLARRLKPRASKGEARRRGRASGRASPLWVLPAAAWNMLPQVKKNMRVKRLHTSHNIAFGKPALWEKYVLTYRAISMPVYARQCFQHAIRPGYGEKRAECPDPRRRDG